MFLSLDKPFGCSVVETVRIGGQKVDRKNSGNPGLA